MSKYLCNNYIFYKYSCISFKCLVCMSSFINIVFNVALKQNMF